MSELMERRGVRRALAIAMAMSSGGLLTLCFPRQNIEELVWLWAAPLMVALWWLPGGHSRGRFWRGFGLGYVAGVTFFAINFLWIREVTVLGAMILPLYLGLFFAVWGGIAATAGRPCDQILGSAPSSGSAAQKPSLMRASFHALQCALLNAAVWVCLEWLRGWLLTGFGWNGLGVAFHQNLNLIQIADIVGVTGLAFLPMFVGCILVTTVRRFQLEIRHQRLRPHMDFGIALAAVAGTFLYGLTYTLRPPDTAPGTELKVVIIQLGVPQEVKWDPDHAGEILGEFERYTSTWVETAEPDLVIWPESSLPTSLFEDPFNERYLNHLLSQGDFALMLGANDFDVANGKYYNGAALMAGQFDSPELQIYHKIHLVPFGEFLPLRKQIPLLDNWLSRLIPGDFDRGVSTEPLNFPGRPIKVTPLICFEDTVGRLARRFVRPQAQIMVNMTNDGWFGTSPAAEQHLANARFRCVELRRPMARACNTGVTCLMDDTGRVLSVLEDPEKGVFTRGALASTLRVTSEPVMSFYARFGDLFTAILAFYAIGSLVMCRCRRRLPPTSTASS